MSRWQSGESVQGKSFTFVLGERIGKGGMGEAYEVLFDGDESSGGKLVFKVLSPYSSTSSERGRIKNVIDYLSSTLRNIPPGSRVPTAAWPIELITDSRDDTGLLMVRVEKLFSLEELLSRPALGDISNKELLSICRHLAQDVEWFHSQGLIVGDLKPGNIMVFRRNGSIKVAWVDLDTFGVETSDLHIQTKFATERYRAPEFVRHDVDHLTSRTDDFALGVIVLSLICRGIRPFGGPDPNGDPLDTDETRATNGYTWLAHEEHDWWSRSGLPSFACRWDPRLSDMATRLADSDLRPTASEWSTTLATTIPRSQKAASTSPAGHPSKSLKPASTSPAGHPAKGPKPASTSPAGHPAKGQKPTPRPSPSTTPPAAPKPRKRRNRGVTSSATVGVVLVCLGLAHFSGASQGVEETLEDFFQALFVNTSVSEESGSTGADSESGDDTSQLNTLGGWRSRPADATSPVCVATGPIETRIQGLPDDTSLVQCAQPDARLQITQAADSRSDLEDCDLTSDGCWTASSGSGWVSVTNIPHLGDCIPAYRDSDEENTVLHYFPHLVDTCRDGEQLTELQDALTKSVDIPVERLSFTQLRVVDLNDDQSECESKDSSDPEHRLLLEAPYPAVDLDGVCAIETS